MASTTVENNSYDVFAFTLRIGLILGFSLGLILMALIGNYRLSIPIGVILGFGAALTLNNIISGSPTDKEKDRLFTKFTIISIGLLIFSIMLMNLGTKINLHLI